MQRASLNHTYRLLWNALTGTWVAVAEIARSGGKRGSAVLLGALLGAPALATPADQLPTGGQIVAGSGSIAQSGNAMTVTQNSQKMITDWQSFSIGANASVNFNQPNAAAIALNRVTGTSTSMIEGALRANGQVFLINPNGVIFGNGARVDVGGLVASTLQLSNSDFLNGNYQFRAGEVAGAIANAGSLNAAGGVVALLAPHVSNTGSIHADGGSVVLAAGKQVRLDFNGDGLVQVAVAESAVDALAANKGLIQADGGLVVMTTQAAHDLLANAVNNEGVIQARTLENREGRILLLAGMDKGQLDAGGKLDASAPTGNGGFIETSAARVNVRDDIVVTTAATQAGARNGTWLLDPTNFTIGSAAPDGSVSSGVAQGSYIRNTTLQTALGAGNVIVQTDAAGAQPGNIYVDAPVSWSANKLTLNAHNNIAVNANLTATGTASLAFVYGQATANGTGSSWNVADGIKVVVPNATAFTWQKGSSGAVTNLVFNNGLLRFGNGSQASLNSTGQLEQPWYFDNVTSGRNGWFKLTYSSYPLDMQIGAGGDGTSSWNHNGELLNTQAGSYASNISNSSLDISGYREGYGTIISTVTATFPTAGQALKVENTYTLGQTAQFIKTDTVVTNLSGSALSNLRLWVGTRDDWVAVSDSNYKFKGNITADGFVQLATQNEQSKAIKIAENNDGVTGAAVLFYSTSAGADTVTDRCCSFSNVTNKDPRNSSIVTPREDGSYALFMRLSDLASGQSGGMTWYYAAAPASQLNGVVTEVSNSAGVTTPTSTPSTTTSSTRTTPESIISQITSQSTQSPVPPVARPSSGNLITASIGSPSLDPGSQPSLISDVSAPPSGLSSLFQAPPPATSASTIFASGNVALGTSSGSVPISLTVNGNLHTLSLNAPATPPVSNDLPVFNTTASGLQSQGSMRVNDTGNSIAVAATAGQSTGVVLPDPASARTTSAALNLPDGSSAEIGIVIGANGVVVIKAPASLMDSLDAKSLVALGLAALKSNLEVSAAELKGVVLEKV